jgi:site-specific DNA recombinase
MDGASPCLYFVFLGQIIEAETGTNADRYGFHEFMSGAKARAFNAVVIYDVTRGSRDVGDWFSFRKTMMMHGVEVITYMLR